jgi:hypothetical protein
MLHNEAHWNTGHDDHIPLYVSSQERQPRAYLSEEEARSHRLAEMGQERHAEMNVYRSAVNDEEVDDCMEDDARRNSLHVEDLIRSFRQVGTDEAGTSQSGASSSNQGSSNQESTESMGTIEPLPMGASNMSLMSMSSLFKSDTPRSSFTQTPRSSFTQGGHSLSGRFSYEKESSFLTYGSRRSSYTRDDSAPIGRRASYQRDFSNRTMNTDHSEDNDMSISMSHIDALCGNGGPRTGHEVSLVIEGTEGEEEASRSSLSFGPRTLQQMAEHPDNLYEMGDSSKNLIYGALGTSSSVLSGAKTQDYRA